MIDTYPELYFGRGGAVSVAQPITNSRRIVKGLRVKALAGNTDIIYVGLNKVSILTGFELSAGDEVFLEIDDPSKIYSIANPSQNQEQTIAISGSVANDTFKLTIDGETTAPIDEDADASAVESALEALSKIAGTDVAVTGGPGPGTDWVVEWTGQYQGINRPLLVASEAGQNEKQTVGIDSASTGGHFHLTYDSQTTDEILHTATAADIKAALELLSNIDQVSVTGGPGPSTDWVVEFQGALARNNVALMTGDGSALTGGTTTVSITETAAGNAATVVVTQSQDAAMESQFSWVAI